MFLRYVPFFEKIKLRIIKEITVEVTQKCNSNCIFCSSFSESKSNSEIPLSKLKEISSFAKNKMAATINISGGEPLLYPDLIPYLSFNKAQNLFTVIYTSGNADFINFFNELEKTDISISDVRFVFNYQSVDSSVFKKLTKTSVSFSLKTLNENIALCLMKQFDVEVHIVPNAININTIFDTCKFLKEFGVSKVSLLRIVYQGRAEKNKTVLKIEENEKLPFIIEKVRKELCDNTFSLRVGIPYSNLISLKTPCYAGTGKYIIKYDGKVFPCEAFKEAPLNKKFIIGDIYTDDLETIWNRQIPPLVELKAKLKDSTCESCPAQLLYI